MERIALFPGSFDPITKGHESIVNRAIPLFDKIIIAVGQNANKNYMFPLEQRLAWIKESFANMATVEVTHYKGLTVSFAKEKNANFILRGLRNQADFEFEKSVAQANNKMETNIETVFLFTESELSYISSSIVRDVIKNNGDYSLFVPDSVKI